MSARMAWSSPVTALACTQRRRKLSTACSTPRPTAAAPIGSSRSRRPWLIAPSIIDLVSSGMAISLSTATIAAASMNASCQRYGRR